MPGLARACAPRVATSDHAAPAIRRPEVRHETHRPFGLLVFAALAAAVEGLSQGPPAPAQAAPGRAMQAPSAPTRPTGIVLVPSLEKPKGARRLTEKDFGGYLLVYFKDQTQSAYFAISRDGYTFTDVNEGQPVFDGTCSPSRRASAIPTSRAGPTAPSTWP